MSRPLRILVAKPGGDGQDRAAETTARALRDAGVEVIYTGLHQTPAMIAETALQEDVDAIVLSVPAGAHISFFPALIDQLRQRTADSVTIVASGDVPPADRETLKTLGVVEILPPGAPPEYLVEWVHTHVRPRA